MGAVKLLLILILSIILLMTFASAYQVEMGKTINLSDLTLEEKIGQLMFVKPSGLDMNYLDELHIGGIFLDNLKSEKEYQEIISFYQDNSKMKLFVATDMEGYFNPFSDFYNSSSSTLRRKYNINLYLHIFAV